MNFETATLFGRYYEGHHAIGSPASLTLLGQHEAVLRCPHVSRRCASEALRVSPRVGRADRFIAVPGGGQFQCADDSRLDDLPQEVPSEGVVAWLEQRVSVTVACVAVVVGVLLVGYVYGLPAAAQHVAARIPVQTEQALGGSILVSLDETWLKPTQLAPDMRARVREGFDALSHDLPMAPSYRLEFRDAPFANAFALPGGTIVITDPLVQAAKSTDEVLAVLAHEIGHVERRHALQQILGNSATAVVVGAITGDASSLSVAVGSLPLVLVATKYSRGFEADADEFAFMLLKQHGLSPEAFATIMEALATDDATGRTAAFLSTHPVTADRIKRARVAGGQA